MKKTFYTELSYVFGLMLLAFGTAMMTWANFGVAMVVAPAYILHLKISEFLPFFSFGMAEYTLQAVLLVIMMLTVRRFKVTYLFSFVTAVIYGLLLDASLMLVSTLPADFAVRIAIYTLGFPVVTFGVALLFNTYISPEAYELFVMEVSKKFHLDMGKVKIYYDIASSIASVAFSFAFFGFGVFRGISWGTLITAIFNGITIRFFCKVLSKNFEFKDKLPLRKIFEH